MMFKSYLMVSPSLPSLPSIPPRIYRQQSWEQVVRDRGPGEPAAHSCSDRNPKDPGAVLETAGAPQPQNCFLWHHLGVTARGGVTDQYKHEVILLRLKFCVHYCTWHDFHFIKVSLMNLLFLVLWAFALPFQWLRPLASSISAVWACVMVVCKMFYQLKVIKPLDYSSNCTAVSIRNCVCFVQLFIIPLIAAHVDML